MYVGTGGRIVNFSKTTVLEKFVSLTIRTHKLSIRAHQLVVLADDFLPLHSSALIVLILFRSHTDSHSYPEFMKGGFLSCPKDSVLLCFSLTFGSYNLSTPFLLWPLKLRLLFEFIMSDSL